MSKEKAKKPVSKKRVVLIILCVILALILVLLIAATVYAERLFGLINRVEPAATTAPSQSVATQPNSQSSPNAPTSTKNTTPVVVAEHMINVLLVGADDGGNLSDTMMLVTVDPTKKTVTLTSFLRDTYVDIPNYFPHKLNTSYSLGGFAVLNDTLYESFGVQVEGNVSVNFDNFVEIIDTIGGLDLELTEDEVWYLGDNFGWWDLTEGVNHLTGEQALHYSRIRRIDGDAQRSNRQRKVISALIAKAKTMSLGEINDLLTTVLPMITTDLTDSDIIGYVMDVLPLLKDLTIVSQQIPAEGTYHLDWVEQDGGMSIIEVDDWDTNVQIIRDTMAG